MLFDYWEQLFSEKIRQVATSNDTAHDILHFQRVVKLAKQLCIAENGNMNVVIPSAWLHDLIIIRKDSPLRSKASQMSADAAEEFLTSIKYPTKYYSEIKHAIAAHSFSANIKTETLEAKIVQDADRLDGLGAIGVARCFATAGLLKRAFYSESDPFCESRTPNDTSFSVDHFYQKLFKVVEDLKTPAGQKEGAARVEFMKNYLMQLKREIY